MSHRGRVRWFEGRKPDGAVWAGPISLELFRSIGALRWTSYRIVDGRLRAGKTWVSWAEHLARSPEALQLLEEFLDLARRWPLNPQPPNTPRGRGWGEEPNC